MMLALLRRMDLGLAASMSAGVVVAAGTIVLLESYPMRWILAILGGLALLLPVFVVKQPRIYGISLFLILLMVQGGKGANLTKNLIDDEMIVATLGIPPLRTLGLMVRPSDIVLLCLIGGWFFNVIARKGKIRMGWPEFIILTYLAWAALTSLLVSRYFDLSVLEFIQQGRVVLFFLYIANAVQTLEQARTLRRVLLACLLVEGSLTLIGLKFPAANELLSLLSAPSSSEVIAPLYEDGTGRRGLGTFTDYASTALYFHFLLPLALSLFLLTAEIRRKCMYLLLYLLGFCGLLATFSRTGFLAEVCGLLAWTLVAYRYRMLPARLLVLSGLCTALLVASLSPWIQSYVMSRPQMTAARFPIMQKALQMIAKRPVLGVGLNNSTAIKKEEFIEAQGMDETSQPVHNHFMILAVESGLVGLALFLGFFALVSGAALQLAKRSEDEVRALGLTVLGAFASVGVHLMFDTMSSYAIYTMLFFYAGLVLALQRMPHSRSMVSRPPNALA
jgi:O-antigen ligase